MRVVVINAGSQSVKLRVIVDASRTVATADLGPPGPDLDERLAEFLSGAGAGVGPGAGAADGTGAGGGTGAGAGTGAAAGTGAGAGGGTPSGTGTATRDLDVAGHRVVHGGRHFTTPVVVDASIRDRLGELAELAPLHNPPALAGIDAMARLRPDVPSVACFDTAFHAGLPAAAATYAIPHEWADRWGVRRYGFHGLSCAYVTARAPKLLDRPAERLRLVVCHLGGGASVTAIAGGRSADTTMGFTPLEGLVMATRAGDLDPGVLLWALSHGVSPDDAGDALEHRSGLSGLTGGRTSDMRELLAWRAAGDGQARLAVEVFVHRLRAKIAAMAAAMGGTDAVVFTGGIGEGSAVVRAETIAGLEWMGLAIDDAVNASAGGEDCDISARGATVRTLVVHTREDLEIAAQCEQVMSGRSR